MGESKQRVNFYGLMQAHEVNRVLLFSSLSKEEKKQPRDEYNISDKWTKNPLPVNGMRTEAHAVDNPGAHGPHQQEAVPDLQLTGLCRKARRIPENAARQQQCHQ